MNAPAPPSPEVIAHELNVQLVEIGARALRAGGDAITRAQACPWWRPLERWARRRESAAVQAAIAAMFTGEEPHAH